jgi:hypothetical protein
MLVKYTPQEFTTSSGNEVTIIPTFYKVKIKVDFLNRKDGNMSSSIISIPMNNISDFITELKKLEREYKAHKIVDDMCKELNKELNNPVN